MKYKIEDRVKVKSLDWYNKNKDNYGCIKCGNQSFVEDMSEYCGQIATINKKFKNEYYLNIDDGHWGWTDDMFEGLVEGETKLKPKFKVGDRVIVRDASGIHIEDAIAWLEKQGKETSWKPSKEEMDVLYGLAYITNKYDEHKEEVITRLYQDLKREFFNGSSYENMFPNTENDVRLAWLEKQGKSALEARTDNELMEEEVGLVDNLSSRWDNEFNLPEGYIFKDENGNVINTTKIVLEKKKKEYPKTYEECAKVLLDRASVRNDFGYKGELLVAFQKLLVCRDAYWKIAGGEMGLAIDATGLNIY